MAFNSILNKIFNLFILRRMEGINQFIEHPIETQQRVLFSLLSQAKNTEYGKLHHFEEIKSYEDFNKQVPIVSYEDFEPFIEKARQGNSDVFWP